MDQEQLLHLLAILRRHGWILVQSIVTVAALSAYFASRAPDPPYRASASLFYEISPTLQDGVDPTSGLAGPFLNRQRQVLAGSTFLTSVAAKLPGESVSSLRRSVRAVVDTPNGLITVTSSASEPSRPFERVAAMVSTFERSTFNDITRPLRDRADDLDRQLTSLQKRLDGINASLSSATAGGRDTTLIEAQQTAALGQYSDLFGAQQKILNQIAVQRRPLGVLDAGSVTRGTKPSPVKRGLLGAVIGAVFGAAVLTLRQLLDTKLRSSEQAEQLTGITVLGELPKLTKRRGKLARRMAVVDDPTGAAAEAVRKLRTAVLFQRDHGPFVTLAVTSAAADPEKTAVAANLAAVCASAGMRTILVSADLANPDLDRWFNAQGTAGLTELLAAQDQLALDIEFEVVMSAHRAAADLKKDTTSLFETFLSIHSASPKVRLLAAGAPAKGRELLASSFGADCLHHLARMADLVILDCAPLTSADGALVAGLADATLVVATNNRTRTGDLVRAARQLQLSGARIIGITVARCAPPPAGVAAVSMFRDSAIGRNLSEAPIDLIELDRQGSLTTR